ncbi:MAG: hypothetical protein H6629_13265 [Calditrichae bacterium]|nr:hypothetical protein [Calditrichia bacterium]
MYLNYLNAIKKAGMEIVAEGLHSKANIAKNIGGRGWLLVHFREIRYRPDRMFSC